MIPYKKVILPAAFFLFALSAASCQPSGESTSRDMAPINPCLNCHKNDTPEIVAQWENGKHSKVGVKCYVCHFASPENPHGMEHNGFSVTSTVEPEVCTSCHPDNGHLLLEQYRVSRSHP